MLRVSGVRQTLEQLKSAQLRLELRATERYRNFVKVVFTDLVAHTPQYAGNLAANWHVVVGAKDAYGSGPSYVEHFSKPINRHAAHIAGDSEAVSRAMARAYAAIEHIKYNSAVAIMNSAPYSDEVDAGLGPSARGTIRRVNQFSGQFVPIHGVAMAAYVEFKYENMRYKRLAYEGRYFNNLTRKQTR